MDNSLITGILVELPCRGQYNNIAYHQLDFKREWDDIANTREHPGCLFDLIAYE